MTFRYPISACAALLVMTSAASEVPGYNRDVRRILSDNCFACHGFDAKHREAELRLDTPEGARTVTENGLAAIKPGSPADSEVWRRIMTTDPDDLMPPSDSHKTLSADEKEIIRKWIAGGANYETHWAFVPPVLPEIPPSDEANPIDAFLAARLKQEGLSRSPEADRETLLRRVSFDLTGLPPTPEEIEAFLVDTSPDAYEQVVDRLLGSPRYGEKMASEWLDVARYGDTNGYLHDIRRTGWPWRDWVIKAFNDDMPFDRFVVEQLAGDLLPDATPEQVLATAFCRNHLITAEGGTIAEEYLNEYAADRVQTVGTVFMGLTMNCCRCHDHKFDPITQADFYSLKAYFNSTTEKHVENNSNPAYPPLIEIASPLAPEGPKAQVMVMQEAANPVQAYVLTRGQYDQPDKSRPVTRRPPEVLGAALAGAPVNRLGLAQWLVSPQDPLLARVTVNRLWQQFFAIGIVKSSDDFGLQGDYPAHPELLDWLAITLRDGSATGKPWSTRQLVRRIVTSASYRQASRIRPEMAETDPENRLLASFPRRRLTAEELRDQALFAAGLMTVQLGGEPVFPYQPAGLWEERSNGGSNTKTYVPSTGAALHRRSLYTFWKRTSPPPFMTIFDAPDRTSCLVRRSATNTPLQALAGFNEEQMLECSMHLAANCLREPGSPTERLARLYKRVTARSANPADLATLDAGLTTLLARFRSTPADAAALLEPGATTIDPALDSSELAAWMLIASTVLNLDQTLVRD